MLEIASIHVPKSGGTSFLEALRAWYPGQVSTFYTCAGHVQGLMPWTSVLHGHYHASMIPAHRHITWMRDPAKRVLSHFYYWRSCDPLVGIDDLHVDVRAGRVGLEEFAVHPSMRNLHARHFGEMRPADFAFVGLVEHTDSEMRRLATILERPPVALPILNTTATAEYRAFKQSGEYLRMLERLHEINALDYELYGEAEALRCARGEEHDQPIAA